MCPTFGSRWRLYQHNVFADPRDARLGRSRAVIEASTLTRTRILPRSRRLLAAFSDDRLALEVKRGNEVAFEIIYDRHHRGLLSLCRYMLRSPEDAEDALQQAFASAFRALPGTEQPVQLKPWLYAIARNRCLSMLRARREHPVEEVEEVEAQSSTVGLSEEVEQRAELRELLADLEHLPERQKSALVLSEVGALDHAHIAQVLECETKQVKSLVFLARSALIENRRAREIPCTEIREQLATASAGQLRRGPLRKHLRQCQGCAEFREDVRRQRGMLALVLPVVPTVGLKESALAAAGIGGGGAAGGGGLIAALGASGAAKIAAVGVAAGGAAGGFVAADPNLLPRAQAAVERATNDVGSVVFGPSAGSRGGEVRGGKVSGLNWDAAQSAARRKTRRDAKVGSATSSGGERPPAAGRAKGGGGDQSGGGDQGGETAAGNTYAYRRGGEGRGSAGRGREGEGFGSGGRGRGRQANRGVHMSDRPSRGGNGRGRGRRANRGVHMSGRPPRGGNGSGQGKRANRGVHMSGRPPRGGNGSGRGSKLPGAGKGGAVLPRKPVPGRGAGGKRPPSKNPRALPDRSFGEEFTPDLREQEERIRAQAEANQ